MILSSHIAKRLLWLSGGLALAALVAIAPIEAATRGALGFAVQGCVVSKQAFGLAFPCLDVEIGHGVDQGYAIVRAPTHSTEILLVPTANIIGIESPAVLDSGSEGYFQEAWSARRFVIDALGHDPGWSAIGMAVNSRPDRSQDRLHIHVDCVRPSVAEALAQHQRQIGPQWTLLPVPLAGAHYWARRVTAADFGALNPFASLRSGLPNARGAMADMTLGVIGGTFEDGSKGFYLLANAAKWDDGSRGTAEHLLDHSCRIGRP